MISFSLLYRRLDETTKTNEKVDALAAYFREADPESAAWTVFYLTGRKLKRVISTRDLRQACLEVSGIPEWLFDECYDVVGDLAETAALLIPEAGLPSPLPLHYWIRERLMPMQMMNEVERREALLASWGEQDQRQRFLWNKLLTGAFRVGVSRGLVLRGLSQALELDLATVEHRLMGDWVPAADFYEILRASAAAGENVSRPYPFALAHPLQQSPELLGDVDEWWGEWKWDGIRAQILRRDDQVYIWSRGEELINEQFPDLVLAAKELPAGFVLDGEIVVLKDGRVQPFNTLQKRLNRRQPGKKVMADAPASYIAFDVLEHEGLDIRALPLSERKERLGTVLSELREVPSRVHAAEVLKATTWDDLLRTRSTSREHGVEGLMLKRRNSPYVSGRVTGVWWKWKIDPYSVDAVLIYAQKGNGRRANLYTDYTFGVWDNGELVPFAKAYSGLTDAEIRDVDRYVRDNTLEQFGPVRVVRPQLVFEIAFENLQASNRHKSGIAVRFPRIAKWRADKRPGDADSLEAVRSLPAQPLARK